METQKKPNNLNNFWEEGECETCWDTDEIKRKGIYRKEYDMTLCIRCVRNAENGKFNKDMQSK